MKNYWKEIAKGYKFGNIPTMLGNDKFASKKEAKRYGELLLMEKAGLITHLTKQPKFKLIDKLSWNGQTLRTCNYIADFSYFEKDNPLCVVEDVKGFKTTVYKLKRHLFLSLYPDIDFREI